MKTKILNLIDFEKVETLLEGFNQSTGFVTAILDLNGNILSKSGWRQICTEFHRIHPETSKRCTISDTILAGQLSADENYHFYKCLNGLVDVAVPIVIKGEHIANLFSGQFLFEKADESFFKEQAKKYGFDEESYFKALSKVPVILEEKVKASMEFLLNMTQLISEMTLQKLEQLALNEELRTSEKTLFNVLNNFNISQSIAKIGSWEWEVASGKVWWSDELYKIFGVDPQYFMPTVESNAEFVHPDDSKPYHDALFKAFEAGEQLDYEIRIITSTGQLKNCRSMGNSILNEDNRPVKMIGTFSDITQKKQTENALIESEQLLIKFQKVAHLGNFTLDLSTGFWESSKILDEIFGIDLDYIRSLEGWSALLHPDWQRVMINYVRNEILIKHQKYDKEFQIIKPNDGKIRWVHVLGELEFDGNNQPIKLIGTILDITERKSAEERLKINEIRLKKGQEIGHFGYWQQEIGSDFIWASDEAMKIYGFHQVAGELHINTIGACTPDINLVRQAAVDLITSNKNYNIEFTISPADGSPNKTISAIAELENDKNGNPIRILGVLQDITERKLAEEEAHEQLDELRHWYEVTLEREGRILELKQEVNELLIQCGEPIRYESVLQENSDI